MSGVPEETVYLKSDTRIEPLCCRWSAWSHLVCPLQQAMNITFRQIPLLRSFLSDPSIHAIASEDPTLLGGPFVNLKESDTTAIRELLERVETTCADLIEFSRSFIELDNRIQHDAQGNSINEFYRSMPARLAGLVEITYDLHNRPVTRILEELSRHANLPSGCTQEIMFCSSSDETRDFFLNTPRINRHGRMFFPAPFESQLFDVISLSRIRPVPFSAVANALETPRDQRQLLRSYFTSQAPDRLSPSYQGDGVRVRYFGHACVLVQTSQTSILIDPCVAWERDSPEASLTFRDLPDLIDYVFITHSHHDHFCPEVLLQLRNRVGTFLVPRSNSGMVADPSMKLALNLLGFMNVQVMDPLDTIPVADGQITSLPFYGEHGDLNIFSRHVMLVSLNGNRLLFVADSLCVDAAVYNRLAKRIGRLDALFIGMECNGAPFSWLYGPYLPSPPSREQDESRRLSASDCDQAWTVVQLLGCKRAYVYAMGQEPWLKYIMGLQYEPNSVQIIESNRFVQRCRDAGIQSERLYGCKEIQL